VQVRRDIALALARGLHAHVGPDILENDDPVGVVTTNFFSF